MSLASVRLEKDCPLQCKCICKSHHELSRPLLLAICTLQEHVVLSNGALISSPRTLGVYDNGFLLLADDREVQIDSFVYEVFHLLDVLAVQQASKIAHQLRSPDLIFSAVVHEGLVVLQRQYLAVTQDRNFALGPSPLNAKKYSETCSSIDWLEFLPYGETEGGVLVRDRRKNKTTYIWFSSFDEQRDFLDLVNGERDAGKKGLDQTKDVPAKNKTTKIFLQNFQQRKFKIRDRGDAMTVLNLGEGRSLIPQEYTV